MVGFYRTVTFSFSFSTDLTIHHLRCTLVIVLLKVQLSAAPSITSANALHTQGLLTFYKISEDFYTVRLGDKKTKKTLPT
jgi:hypothetical protein